jgi:hypothetical protein
LDREAQVPPSRMLSKWDAVLKEVATMFDDSFFLALETSVFLTSSAHLVWIFEALWPWLA